MLLFLMKTVQALILANWVNFNDESQYKNKYHQKFLLITFYPSLILLDWDQVVNPIYYIWIMKVDWFETYKFCEVEEW